MALHHGANVRWAFVCLDGTSIEVSHARAHSALGPEHRCSGEHHTHDRDLRVPTGLGGFPIWTAPVEPVSSQGITGGRTPVLATLYPAAAAGLPTRSDQDCTGAEICIDLRPIDANLFTHSQRGNARASLRRMQRVFTAWMGLTAAIPHRQGALEILEWDPD